MALESGSSYRLSGQHAAPDVLRMLLVTRTCRVIEAHDNIVAGADDCDSDKIKCLLMIMRRSFSENRFRHTEYTVGIAFVAMMHPREEQAEQDVGLEQPVDRICLSENNTCSLPVPAPNFRPTPSSLLHMHWLWFVHTLG